MTHEPIGGDTSAFACGEPLQQNGLTAREYFAARAMQGILEDRPPVGRGPERIADMAVLYADALIARLNRTSENTP